MTASGCCRGANQFKASSSDNDEGTHLAVDVLEAAHDDAVEVLSELDLLEVDLGLDDSLVDLLLVLEAIDVLSGVRVDVLKALGELVVEAVDERDDAAADDDGGLRVGRGALDGIVVVGGALLDDVGALGGENLEERVEVSAGGGPRLDGHVSVGGGVVVEEGRDEGEENADLLVGGDGDGEELVEDLGLLGTVGVLRGRGGSASTRTAARHPKEAHLASTGLEDLSESLVDTLGGDGDGLALVADSLERVVVLLLGVDGERSLLGLGLLLDGSGGVFGKGSLLESLGVL